jgi:hypothetical protein
MNVAADIKLPSVCIVSACVVYVMQLTLEASQQRDMQENKVNMMILLEMVNEIIRV